MNFNLGDYRVLVGAVPDDDERYLLQELADIAEFEIGEERERTINVIREKLKALNIIKL